MNGVSGTSSGPPRLGSRRGILLVCLLGLALRLYGVSTPVGGVHGWRQADTAAMARNFAGGGFRIWEPRIDWGGAGSGAGRVESEFPLFPFLVSLLYGLFGVADIWGRLLAALLSTCSIYALYLLVRRILSVRIALWASFLFAILPLNIFYGRAFMGESSLILFSILGIYYFDAWLETERVRHAVLAWLWIALALLIKVPTLYLGLPLAYLAWYRFRWRFLSRWQLWAWGVLVLLPIGAWLTHANQIRQQSGLSFGIWELGSGKWGNPDLLASPSFYADVFFGSIAEKHLTWAGVPALLVGLLLHRHGGRERVFDAWLIAVVLYIVIVARGNLVHEYYQLPFTVPAVVFMAKAFDRYLRPVSPSSGGRARSLKTILAAVCLIGIAILSALRLAGHFRFERRGAPVARLAEAVRALSTTTDLVVTAGTRDPTLLYRSRRKGWVANPQELDEAALQRWLRAGARLVAGEKGHFRRPKDRPRLRWLLRRLDLIRQDSAIFVGRLRAGTFPAPPSR